MLIGPLLRFLINQRFQLPFTIIVLDTRPRRYWRELLQATSFVRFLLGRKGDDSVLLFPSITWDASPDRFNGTSGLSVASVDFRPLFAEEHIKLPAWDSLL